MARSDVAYISPYLPVSPHISPEQEGIAWRAVTWPDNAGCLQLIAQAEM